MKTKVVNALVKIAIPANWNKMTPEQQLQWIRERQDNHIMVDIIKIK